MSDDTSTILTSPLGALGLDYRGVYSSFPSMGGIGSGMSGVYGLNNGMYGYNGMAGMLGYGNNMYGLNGITGANGMPGMYGSMMGMYNPEYMMGMMQNIEKAQVNHANDMHAALTQAEVNNLSAHNRAIFQKIADDSEIQSGIRNLESLIRSGDGSGVVMEFKKIRSNICTKFAKEISMDPTGDTKSKVDRYIKQMYGQIASKQAGVPADFDQDVKDYGESAFKNGFFSTFLGNKDHSKLTAEEELSEINGTRLNDKSSKRRAKWAGGWLARITEGALAWGAGFIGGMAALGAGKLVISSVPGSSKLGIKATSGMGLAGKLGALALLGADACWQLARD